MYLHRAWAAESSRCASSFDKKSYAAPEITFLAGRLDEDGTELEGVRMKLILSDEGKL